MLCSVIVEVLLRDCVLAAITRCVNWEDVIYLQNMLIQHIAKYNYIFVVIRETDE